MKEWLKSFAGEVGSKKLIFAIIIEYGIYSMPDLAPEWKAGSMAGVVVGYLIGQGMTDFGKGARVNGGK